MPDILSEITKAVLSVFMGTWELNAEDLSRVLQWTRDNGKNWRNYTGLAKRIVDGPTLWKLSSAAGVHEFYDPMNQKEAELAARNWVLDQAPISAQYAHIPINIYPQGLDTALYAMTVET